MTKNFAPKIWWKVLLDNDTAVYAQAKSAGPAVKAARGYAADPDIDVVAVIPEIQHSEIPADAVVLKS